MTRVLVHRFVEWSETPTQHRNTVKSEAEGTYSKMEVVCIATLNWPAEVRYP